MESNWATTTVNGGYSYWIGLANLDSRLYNAISASHSALFTTATRQDREAAEVAPTRPLTLLFPCLEGWSSEKGFSPLFVAKTSRVKTIRPGWCFLQQPKSRARNVEDLAAGYSKSSAYNPP